MSKVLELKEQRSKIVADQREILATADKENNGKMTEEQDVRYNKFEAEDVELGKRIQREESLEARQAEADAQEGRKVDATKEERKAIETAEEITKRASKTFGKYLRNGFEGLDSKQKEAFIELRAQGKDTASEGGYTVPVHLANKIEKALLDVSGARQIANVMKTATGALINFPTNNDTGNVGVLLAENIAAGEQDTVFSSKPIESYTYTSKMVRVSNRLIEDSDFDIMDYIAGIGAERIGRGTNAAFTTGDGSGKPEGFITGASTGLTAAGTTAITFDELISLEHTIDPSYRRTGNSGSKFTFNDATFAAIKKLKDGDGNYLWLAPNGRDGAAGTILGYQYVVNQSMASMATGLIPVAFGDFSKFLVRDSGTPSILRLKERFAEYDQTAFLMFSRHDSVVLDAGTKPIKYITMA